MPLAVTVRSARQVKLVGGIHNWRQPRKRPIMSTLKLILSASRGTLAGHLLWLAIIAIGFAVITGLNAGLAVYG
jgi:type IV secretory pathway VirB2 component (pilin)